MALSETLSLCAACKGAEQSQPFGDGVEVFKIAGKIFAAVSARGVCVKTPDVETAGLLIEMGRAVKAPYFHASWVLVPHGVEELAERIACSHALIRASLPKKLQAGFL